MPSLGATSAVFANNGYVAVRGLLTADEDRGLNEKAVIHGLGMEIVNERWQEK